MKVIKTKILKVDLAVIPDGMTLNNWLKLYNSNTILFDSTKIKGDNSQNLFNTFEIETTYFNLFERLWYNVKNK